MRLAVWGDPIAHSRSPQLHAAAYAVLGLDWTYERRRVDALAFDAALAELGPQWRGLSVTMPLKERAFSASSTRDRRAELTGAVNTLLLGGAGGPRGFNTDVGGIVRALNDRGVARVESARIVGAGSTASSAVVALQEMGAREIEIVARRPDRAEMLAHLGEALGTRASIQPLSGTIGRPVDVTVATLPSGTELPENFADVLADGGGALLDAAYAPWPSHLGRAWERRGGVPISGVEMLLHQALLQVRIFVTGDLEAPLSDELLVLAAMRAALMGD